MSKILHAKQSRCLKSKHLAVLIHTEQNLKKDLLNYLKSLKSFFVCIFYRFDKGRQCPTLICISAAQLTFMELQVKTSVHFPISNLNTASRNYSEQNAAARVKSKNKSQKTRSIHNPLTHMPCGLHFVTLLWLKCYVGSIKHKTTVGVKFCSFTPVQVWRDCIENHSRSGLPQLCKTVHLHRNPARQPQSGGEEGESKVPV